MREIAPLSRLADELARIAWREALGAESLEILAARHGDQPVFTAALAEVRRDAALAAQAASLLKALVPHEAIVRALLGAEEA